MQKGSTIKKKEVTIEFMAPKNRNLSYIEKQNMRNLYTMVQFCHT